MFQYTGLMELQSMYVIQERKIIKYRTSQRKALILISFNRKGEKPGKLLRRAAAPAKIYRSIHKTMNKNCYIIS